MMRQVGSLVLVIASWTSAAMADCPPSWPGGNTHAPGEVLLRVAPTSTIDEVLARLNQVYPGTSALAASVSRGVYQVNVPVGTLECDVLDTMLTTMVFDPNAPDPNDPLLWAELNYESESAEGSTGSIYISNQLPTAAQFYQQQYAVQMLGMTAAHQSATGRGVAVAVLDTGVDAEHPALQGAVLPGYNFVADGPDTSESADGVDNDGDGVFDEMFGHGTFNAGLIHLTAPEAKILPVVVLNDDGVGETFDIIRGIYYAIDHGVEVINMSFGSSEWSKGLSEALEEARQHGILVVASAGNDNRSEPPRMPATSGDAIGVTAVDDHNVRAPFSNYHDDVFLSAPGATAKLPNGQPDPNRAVYSTIPGEGYASWEGTSLAAAFASGTAALIRSQHPEWPRTTYAAEQTMDLMAATSINIDALNPGFENKLGVGRIDPAAAVAAGPAMPLLGDLDADGDVDLADLAGLLSDFGAVHSSADVNADGVVDLTDLAVMLSAFTG